MNDAAFLHTLTPAESDALEDRREPGSSDHPRAAISPHELISRRLRATEARRLAG